MAKKEKISFFFSKNCLFYKAVISYSHNKEKGDKIMGQILETIMLLCFGFSWPLNVIKAYKAKTTKGTSLPFIILIITGYVAGITAKILTNQINYVLIAYILNLAIVSINVLVYLRNYTLDKKRMVKGELKNA